MTTIWEKVDKHFRIDLKKAKEVGYKQGWKEAMAYRWKEVLRGKGWLERFKLIIK